jgi:uncharacterized membrane protein
LEENTINGKRTRKMQKYNLTIGIVFVLIGAVFSYMGKVFGGDANTFSGIGICIIGVLYIIRYLYLNLPQNRQAAKQAVIDNNVDWKNQLRYKAGYLGYFVGMVIIVLSMFAYEVLEFFEIIEPNVYIYYYLGGCLVIQLFVGATIFKILVRKHNKDKDF